MKLLIFAAILLSSLSIFGQTKVKVYQEQIENGFRILADNDELCAVSTEITLSLKNMTSSNGNKFTFVLPAKSQKNIITDLTVNKPSLSSKMGIESSFSYGDYRLKPDSAYAYLLPFKKGDSFKISQGYNGNRTHQKENALDFDMPESTEVHAVRDGIVIKVVQNNNRHCTSKDCVKYNNCVTIYHSDGTFADYVHLKKNGAVVQEGDSVKAGQLIAYSGNTGWSSGPHLHLVVYANNVSKRKTLSTFFKTGNGKQTEILLEKKEYKRDY